MQVLPQTLLNKNVQSVKTMQSLQVKCRKNLSDILTNKEIIPNKELEIPALIVFLKCQYTISIQMNMVTSTPSTSHERSTPSTPITTLHMTSTTKAHPEYTPTEEISTTVKTTATVTVTTHPESPERQKPGVGEILTYTFGVVIGTTLF